MPIDTANEKMLLETLKPYRVEENLVYKLVAFYKATNACSSSSSRKREREGESSLEL